MTFLFVGIVVSIGAILIAGIFIGEDAGFGGEKTIGIGLLIPSLIALVICMFVLSVKIEEQGIEKGYKQGQIDYYNGKIKYELMKNDNSEDVWTRVK